MTAQTPPTIKELETIVAKVAPTVYLHPEEKYMPSSFEWYLARVDCVQPNRPTIKAPRPDQLPTGEESRKAYLTFDWKNEKIKKGDLSTAKAYVHVADSIYVKDGFDIQYWFFYPFNGPATLEFTKCKFSVAPGGEHEGDWEMVTVVVDRLGNLQKMYCSQHNYGTWYEKSDLEFEKGHPVVYSALNGHPSFVKAGEFNTRVSLPKGFSLPNFTGKGQRWDCTTSHQIIAVDVKGVGFPPAPWLGFLGRAGADNSAAKKEVVKELEAKGYPGLIAEGLADALALADGFGGPVMPAGKGDWLPKHLVWRSAGEPVSACYGPEHGQSARSSPNFGNLNIPDSAVEIKFYAQTGVPPEEDKQVVFAIDHDKFGPDTRWYTNVTSSVAFDPRGCGPDQPHKGCGGTGEQKLYVITTKIPAGKQPKDTYTVEVYWR